MADEAVIRIVLQDTGGTVSQSYAPAPQPSAPPPPPTTPTASQSYAPPQSYSPQSVTGAQPAAPAPATVTTASVPTPARQSPAAALPAKVPQDTAPVKPPAQVFNPQAEADKMRAKERQRALIEEAYEKKYGGGKEEESGTDSLLKVADALRGTIGGLLGPIVGAVLDAVSGFRKAQVEAAKKQYDKELLAEAKQTTVATREVRDAVREAAKPLPPVQETKAAPEPPPVALVQLPPAKETKAASEPAPSMLPKPVISLPVSSAGAFVPESPKPAIQRVHQLDTREDAGAFRRQSPGGLPVLEPLGTPGDTFRALARKYHPDRNIGDVGAAEKWKEISAAHEEVKRASLGLAPPPEAIPVPQPPVAQYAPPELPEDEDYYSFDAETGKLLRPTIQGPGPEAIPVPKPPVAQVMPPEPPAPPPMPAGSGGALVPAARKASTAISEVVPAGSIPTPTPAPPGDMGLMKGLSSAIGIVAIGIAIGEAVKAAVVGGIKSVVGGIGGIAQSIASPDTDPSVPIAKLGDAASSAGEKIFLLNPAIGTAAVLFGETGKALAGLMQNLDKTAERYGEFNPQIAQQQAMAEVRQAMGDLRRSQEIAPELARYVRVQSELTQKFEDIKVKLLTQILAVVNPILEILERIVPDSNNIAGSLAASAGAVTSFVGPVGAAAQAISQIANFLAARDEPADPTTFILEYTSGQLATTTQLPGG